MKKQQKKEVRQSGKELHLCCYRANLEQRKNLELFHFCHRRMTAIRQMPTRASHAADGYPTMHSAVGLSHENKKKRCHIGTILVPISLILESRSVNLIWHA
jgi:hypothetical protein